MTTLQKIQTVYTLVLLFFVFPLCAQNTFIDHDNDGIEDAVDLDDDNDGILDTEELKFENKDIDADGILNHLDLDSDNDGLTDAAEAFGLDVNGDGIVDGFRDEDHDGLMDEMIQTRSQLDMDADGLPNFLDIDSDNDGLSDAAAAGGIDLNNDGRLDGYRDADYDGLNDLVDGDIGNILAPGDNSMTSSSKNILNAKGYFKKLSRLARACEDLDFDGFCDCYDGDLGNQLRIGYDFELEEL